MGLSVILHKDGPVGLVDECAEEARAVAKGPFLQWHEFLAHRDELLSKLSRGKDG